MKLKFSGPMKYYKDRVYEFNLPAGWSCPKADVCLSKAEKDTGKLSKGKHQEFDCYAARLERFPNVRERRWENFELIKKLRSKEKIVSELMGAIPKTANRIRIHGSGDFYNQVYFDAWLEVCKKNPNILFWAFTKSVRLWVNRINDIPSNLILQASKGGKEDDLIHKYDLKSATVFRTVEEAKLSGMPIDTDDYYACNNEGSFALVDNFGPDKGGRINNN